LTKPWEYIRLATEAFGAAAAVGAASVLVFPKLPQYIVTATKSKVMALANMIPVAGAYKVAAAITLWNFVAVVMATFGGLIALMLDKIAVKYSPHHMRVLMEGPPYADLVIKAARFLFGYEGNDYKEADVILTLKLGPLIVPAINGFAAGAFFCSLATTKGAHEVLKFLMAPNGYVEFPAVILAGAMGLHMADLLIDRIDPSQWPDVDLRVPPWVVRNVSIFLLGIIFAAVLEVKVAPIIVAKG